MQVEEELAGFSPQRDMLLTIGVFDGVHLGHRHLISRLVSQARQQNLLSGVVTFYQHPRAIVAGASLPFLADPEERSQFLKGEGVDAVILLSFTVQLAELSIRQFADLLQKHLRMRGLVIGPDFAAGRGREGDIDTLRKVGEEMGFSVTTVSPLVINGEVVSSTLIRKAVAEGDMGKVARLAGHPYSLHGQVVSGTGRGAGLGFPTANLDIDQNQAIPADGVYASWAYVDGNAYQSMTNIGICPTFGGCERTAEIFLLDYQGDLYGHELKVEIIERLRDEVKFDSVAELQKQVAEDVKRGKAILAARSQN